MREMILRKQAQENRDTFHLNRHNQNMFGDKISVADYGMMTPASVSESQIVYHADAQRLGTTSQRFSRKTTTGRAKARRSN